MSAPTTRILGISYTEKNPVKVKVCSENFKCFETNNNFETEHLGQPFDKRVHIRKKIKLNLLLTNSELLIRFQT